MCDTKVAAAEATKMRARQKAAIHRERTNKMMAPLALAPVTKPVVTESAGMKLQGKAPN